MSLTAEVLLSILSIAATACCFLLGWAIHLLQAIRHDLVDLMIRTNALEERDAAKEVRLSQVEQRCWEAHGGGTPIHVPHVPR